MINAGPLLCAREYFHIFHSDEPPDWFYKALVWGLSRSACGCWRVVSLCDVGPVITAVENDQLAVAHALLASISKAKRQGSLLVVYMLIV